MKCAPWPKQSLCSSYSLVCVQSATRGTVRRHRLFDATLTGVARDAAIRRAFLDACKELRAALM